MEGKVSLFIKYTRIHSFIQKWKYVKYVITIYIIHDTVVMIFEVKMLTDYYKWWYLSVI